MCVSAMCVCLSVCVIYILRIEMRSPAMNIINDDDNNNSRSICVCAIQMKYKEEERDGVRKSMNMMRENGWSVVSKLKKNISNNEESVVFVSLNR